MLALLVVAVFVSAMVIDFADCHCTLAITERRANQAALWSIFQYAVGAFGFLAIVQVSMWLMIPEGLGLFVGTRLALRKGSCKS